MTANGNGKRIETLIAAEQWEKGQRAIEKKLDKESDNHWLWSRLSSVVSLIVRRKTLSPVGRSTDDI